MSLSLIWMVFKSPLPDQLFKFFYPKGNPLV